MRPVCKIIHIAASVLGQARACLLVKNSSSSSELAAVRVQDQGIPDFGTAVYHPPTRSLSLATRPVELLPRSDPGDGALLRRAIGELSPSRAAILSFPLGFTSGSTHSFRQLDLYVMKKRPCGRL